MSISLPSNVIVQLYELRRSAPVYDPANGGQYIKQPPERIAFTGAVLPLSADDLRRAPAGSYTEHTRKLYTEQALVTGTEIEYAGQPYTVSGDLNHGTINPLRRYIIERKG